MSIAKLITLCKRLINFIYITIDGPVFKTFPKSVEADIDTSVSLQCDVDGNPIPDILWIHEPSDRVRYYSFTSNWKRKIIFLFIII